MQRTAFYDFHVSHGGKMVDFAGWEMPIHFGSIRDEHLAVRNHAGMFDVSHMGRVKFSGRHARRFLERILTRRVSSMEPGRCRYTLLCNDQGGTLDDGVIYRFDDHWILVCNAANRPKLLDHFRRHAEDLAVQIEDKTEELAMVALQGPEVMEMLGEFSSEVPQLKKFAFTQKNLLALKMVISRTGYTGEDGVEVILPSKMVPMAQKLLLKQDSEGNLNIRPCGLGARDTLRLEAGLPLYGHELDETTDPLSAGLGFAVSLDKDQDTQYGDPEQFIGQEALKKVAEEGSGKHLVGLKVEGRRTPRQGMAVMDASDPVGEVTSGCLSPVLEEPIAMAYVRPSHAEPGTSLTVDFGRRSATAEVVKMPFYQPTGA